MFAKPANARRATRYELFSIAAELNLEVQLSYGFAFETYREAVAWMRGSCYITQLSSRQEWFVVFPEHYPKRS